MFWRTSQKQFQHLMANRSYKFGRISRAAQSGEKLQQFQLKSPLASGTSERVLFEDLERNAPLCELFAHLLSRLLAGLLAKLSREFDATGLASGGQQ